MKCTNKTCDDTANTTVDFEWLTTLGMNLMRKIMTKIDILTLLFCLLGIIACIIQARLYL